MDAASSPLWNEVRHRVVPLVFVLGFPPGLILMSALVGEGRDPRRISLWTFAGTPASWAIVAAFAAWAVLFLRVLPSRSFAGRPEPRTGFVPTYRANGFAYYCATTAAFAALIAVRPRVATLVCDSLPDLLATLNVVAFALCAWLLFRGRRSREGPSPPPREARGGGGGGAESSLVFAFYRGMEVHPRLLGMDVKQLVNCRLGLMGWQLLVLACWRAGAAREAGGGGGGGEGGGGGWGSSWAAANALLQTLYLAKFFWWETGYFDTLDITLDRAGFYICWGCLTFVPGLYAFSSHYLAAHPCPDPDGGGSSSSSSAPRPHPAALATLLAGAAAVLLNYLVDREKEVFRASGGKRALWTTARGKRPRCVEAVVAGPGPDGGGPERRRRLLLASGFWGVARHLNYTFEWLAALLWCLPAACPCGEGAFGWWALAYPAFLGCLLVHRVFRDEGKCAAKYGEAWTRYCALVPYRLVPGVF